MIKRKNKIPTNITSKENQQDQDVDSILIMSGFRTHEPDFYKKMYQTKFRGDDTKTFQIFGLPIDNAKITRKVQFHPAAPVIKYHQKTSTSCCFSSLASDFHCICDNRAVPDLVNSIEISLTLQIEICKNRFHFANEIMTNYSNNI